MLSAKPRPDEFIRGLRGRLRVLNDFSTVASYMAALRNEVEPQEALSANFWSGATLALAATIPLPLQQLIRSHSLLPVHCAVTAKGSHVLHGDPFWLNRIDSFATRAWRQTDAWFCRDCVRADLEYREFPYWRLSQQLPGVPWCVTHCSQLECSPFGMRAFDDMLSLNMEGQCRYPEPDFTRIYANTAIHRYVKIIGAFLGSERPMNLVHARFRIATRARKQGLRISESGTQTTLTDRMVEELPKSWLLAQYPSIENRSVGEFFAPIDNIVVGRVQVPVYALALAVLFQSAEEALNYWFGDVEGQPFELESSRRFHQDSWNIEKILDLYAAHGGNCTSMGEALGVEPANTGIWLTAAGLRHLDLADFSTTVKAVLDIRGGKSLDAACESNGVSRDYVERLLRGGTIRLCRARQVTARPKNIPIAKSPNKIPLRRQITAQDLARLHWDPFSNQRRSAVQRQIKLSGARL